MAFEMIEKYRLYICQSGDTKKTTEIEEGSFCFETDTQKRYIFNGSNWVLFSEMCAKIPSNTKSATSLVTVDTTEDGVEILGSNTDRIRLLIQNQGIEPALLSFGENPSITNYSIVLPAASGIRLGDGGSFDSETWKGTIRGLTETGSTIISVFEEVIE